MNKFEIENRLNELKNCEAIVILHYIDTFVYEVFNTKDIVNCPEYNCLKCTVGNRTIKYNNIKSIGPSP